MADKIFPEGIMFKLPGETAPDYVKGKILIKSEEAIAFIKSQNSEWISLDLLVSKGGKPYCAVDTWKKDPNHKKFISEHLENQSQNIKFILQK